MRSPISNALCAPWKVSCNTYISPYYTCSACAVSASDIDLKCKLLDRNSVAKFLIQISNQAVAWISYKATHLPTESVTRAPSFSLSNQSSCKPSCSCACTADKPLGQSWAGKEIERSFSQFFTGTILEIYKRVHSCRGRIVMRIRESLQQILNSES